MGGGRGSGDALNTLGSSLGYILHEKVITCSEGGTRELLVETDKGEKNSA
jgi:hypothetical protein